MFFHFFQYIKFLLKSTNQHGVHSPFVYHLVTKCFYTQGNQKHIEQYREIEKKTIQSKEVNFPKLRLKKPKLLLKVIAYFKPTNSLEISNLAECLASTLKIVQPNATVNAIATTFKATDNGKNLLKNTNSKPFDMVFFISTEEGILSYFENCLSKIHNETFFIFRDLYQSKEMKTAWAQIKQHPKVTVTIDVFYYGFVFIRKEQQKEHFKIRI